ncbi:hypothetical protein E2562_027685, partial [Oryza meyeriana var. granulata]
SQLCGRGTPQEHQRSGKEHQPGVWEMANFLDKNRYSLVHCYILCDIFGLFLCDLAYVFTGIDVVHLPACPTCHICRKDNDGNELQQRSEHHRAGQMAALLPHSSLQPMSQSSPKIAMQNDDENTSFVWWYKYNPSIQESKKF